MPSGEAQSDGGKNPFNSEMTIVSGGDKSIFTKTPANITRNHFDGPGLDKPVQRAGKSAGKKRKAAGDDPGAQKSKGKGKEKAAATPDAVSNAVVDTLPPQQKKKRQFKGKTTAARLIPRTYESCDEADRMLVSWRDEKKDWGPIKAEWKRLTGEATAQSTLPNRYARIKTNFAILNEEDNALLIQTKREIEDSFQAQKWTLIANLLVSKGGADHTALPIILQRQWKKLMTKGGAIVPHGILDKDFEDPLLSGDEDENGNDADVE